MQPNTRYWNPVYLPYSVTKFVRHQFITWGIGYREDSVGYQLIFWKPLLLETLEEKFGYDN